MFVYSFRTNRFLFVFGNYIQFLIARVSVKLLFLLFLSVAILEGGLMQL